ncbi:hypothetical protein LIA77_04063 [Sarocladium implicatum]|nr:hypothetical protein LIA77_04063 [Sarocladium implicatum]
MSHWRPRDEGEALASLGLGKARAIRPGMGMVISWDGQHAGQNCQELLLVWRHNPGGPGLATRKSPGSRGAARHSSRWKMTDHISPEAGSVASCTTARVELAFMYKAESTASTLGPSIEVWGPFN